MMAAFSASAVAASPGLGVVTSSTEDASSPRGAPPLAAWLVAASGAVCDRVEVEAPNPELGAAIVALAFEPVVSISLDVRSLSYGLGPTEDNPSP
jgi:hypothetical protein